MLFLNQWRDYDYRNYSTQTILKTFDLVTYFLTPHNQFSNLTKILQTFWWRFMTTGTKLWPLEFEQGFKDMWPSDKTNILKFQED